MTSATVFGVRMFLIGGLTVGYWVAALFFLRYWQRSNDQLFVMFAAAFALLGIQNIWFAGTAVMGIVDDGVLLWPYVIRLTAFTLILWAIIDKNRRR